MDEDAGLLQKILERPGPAFRAALALLRGRYYCLLARLRGSRVTVGKRFRVYGRLEIRGPGQVIFGDNVRIAMLVTPYTHHPDAVIRIGDDSYLNGTRFGCRQCIEVGPRAILAQASIMDTNFHSVSADRHDPAAPVRTEPVVLEENVWIASQAGILPGTRIGRNSVVGFGAVCSGSYPPDTIIGGNPATPLRPIPPSAPRPAAPER